MVWLLIFDNRNTNKLAHRKFATYNGPSEATGLSLERMHTMAGMVNSLGTTCTGILVESFSQASKCGAHFSATLDLWEKRNERNES